MNQYEYSTRLSEECRRGHKKSSPRRASPPRDSKCLRHMRRIHELSDPSQFNLGGIKKCPKGTKRNLKTGRCKKKKMKMKMKRKSRRKGSPKAGRRRSARRRTRRRTRTHRRRYRS